MFFSRISLMLFLAAMSAASCLWADKNKDRENRDRDNNNRREVRTTPPATNPGGINLGGVRVIGNGTGGALLQGNVQPPTARTVPNKTIVVPNVGNKGITITPPIINNPVRTSPPVHVPPATRSVPVPNVTIQLPHNANNATNNVLQGMKVIKNPNHDTHVHNANTPPASSTFVQRNLNNLPKNNTPLGNVLPQGSNVRILPTQPRVVVPTKTPPIANFPIYRTNKPVPPLPPPQQTPPRHDHDDHDHHHHHYPTQNNYVWYPYGYGGYNSGYGGYYGNYGSYYPNYNSSYYNSPYYGYGYSRFGVSLSIGGSPSYSYVPRTSYYGSTSYGSYGSSYDSSTTYSSPAYTSPTYSTGASRLIVGPATDTTLEPADRAGRTSHDFAADGEREFKAGNYQTAVRNWRHALVDEPNNGAYLLLLSQGLFATGDFEEAAGVTQHAARSVSPEHWNVVVKNYKELYGSIQDYTNQLRALEKARSEKPDSPALRFLLGWHYGFLGYPQDAVTQLDKLLELVPEDEIGKTLREQFAAQLPKSELPPAPVEGRKI